MSDERRTDKATNECAPHGVDVGFCTVHGGHFLSGVCNLADRPSDDPDYAPGDQVITGAGLLREWRNQIGVVVQVDPTEVRVWLKSLNTAIWVTRNYLQRDPCAQRRERATTDGPRNYVHKDFHAAVVEKTRVETIEACAKVCDDHAHREGMRDPVFYSAEVGAVKRASAAIRGLASLSSRVSSDEEATGTKESGK